MRSVAAGRAAGWLAALAAAAALGGCGAGSRGGVATNNVSACASVLPLTRNVVGDRGRLVRIHRLRRGQAAAILRSLGRPAPSRPRTPAERSPRREPKRCLIVYRGPYRRGQVRGASGQRGRYAAIVARVRPRSIVGVALTDRLPRGVRR